MDRWIDRKSPSIIPGKNAHLTNAVVTTVSVFIVIYSALGMPALRKTGPEQEFLVPKRHLLFLWDAETCQ